MSRVRSLVNRWMGKVAILLGSFASCNEFKFWTIFCVLYYLVELVKRSLVNDRIDKVIELLHVTDLELGKLLLEVLLGLWPGGFRDIYSRACGALLALVFKSSADSVIEPAG